MGRAISADELVVSGQCEDCSGSALGWYVLVPDGDADVVTGLVAAIGGVISVPKSGNAQVQPKAVVANGQLVNLDGNANRVAALCFGPESVLVIAGMNKVMGDLDSAIARARQVAAPANAQRFDIKTPCAVTGSCGDCTSPDCICCQMVITRVCRPAGRIKVILVGEDLGF